jgi:hypothetical protein
MYLNFMYIINISWKFSYAEKVYNHMLFYEDLITFSNFFF